MILRTPRLATENTEKKKQSKFRFISVNSVLSDVTPGHSTRQANNASQVAGYVADCLKIGC